MKSFLLIKRSNNPVIDHESNLSCKICIEF